MIKSCIIIRIVLPMDIYIYIYIYISTSPRLSVKYYHDAPHPSHTSTISIDITNIVQPYFNPEFHEVSVSRII